jgi:acyl carrier protein
MQAITNIGAMNTETLDVAATVKELAAKQVGRDASGISEATHFVNDLNFDSLDFIDFTIKVEERFGLTVDEATAQTLMTVGSVIEFVTRERTGT